MRAFGILVAILAASVSAFSQTHPAYLAACGDFNVSMAVKLGDNPHAAAHAEAGKALIYFIQDTGLTISVGYPTTRIGVDGDWVGANRKNSYFSISVSPGEHHLCAAVQSSFVRRDVELAHLTAEAGKVYFFRTRLILSNSGVEYLGFTPVDSDEGQYLIASYPIATAHARK